ncbi:hypothetical protein ACFWPP_31860 [Streptomyces anulatus]|uniref:hypothetical protein n=1 Tax=Streptomyces anulatus TaxID=1892 RepID=UPI003659CD7B
MSPPETSALIGLLALCRWNPHPAGPTAIDILSIVLESEDREVRPDSAGDDRLQRIGVPYAGYLRDGQALEDVRELVLTLGLCTACDASLPAWQACKGCGYITVASLGVHGE